MIIENLTPDNYRDARLAGVRSGCDKEVREFIRARDQAEAEAEAAKPKKVWVRNPNFVRSDMMPGYEND
jgi:hypothetical protein